jgi:hypothetical protein
MFKKFLPLIISILAVVILVLGGSYYWYTTSVYVAYANFSQALKDKNLSEAKKYMDVDKFVASQFNDAKELFGGLNEAEAGFLNNSSLKQSIEEAITRGEFIDQKYMITSPVEVFNKNILQADGAKYKLELELFNDAPDGIKLKSKFYFTKESEGWKLTDSKTDYKLLQDSIIQETNRNSNFSDN